MKHIIIILVTLNLFSLLYAGGVAAGTLSGKIRVDDEFRMYLSTDNSREGTLIAQGSQWDRTFSINANLNDGQRYYIHVYAKDTGGVAGLLADLNLSGGYHVFANNRSHIVSNTSNWKVSTSGWGSYANASNSNGTNGTSSTEIASEATWLWAADTARHEVYFSLAILSQNTRYPGEINGKIRVDDQFSVYLSADDNQQGTLIASGNNWQHTGSVDARLTDGQDYYLHVHGVDTSDIAAFLGDFSLTGTDHVFINNQKRILTNTTDWNVSTTGWSNYAHASVANGNNGVDPWGPNPQMSSDATWIWSSNPTGDDQAYFSVQILSQSKVRTPTLSGNLTVDNQFGVFVSTDDNVAGDYLGYGNDWRTTYTFSYDLSEGQDYYLHIYAEDREEVAAFIGQFSLTGDDHVFVNNQTDILTNITDWGLSETGWDNYIRPSIANGKNGTSPWGARPYISTDATWIWTSDLNNDNKAYFTLGVLSKTSTVLNPLAFYEFEQDTWAGANSILDSSVKSNQGSPYGSISPRYPIGEQKSCKILSIDANTSASTITALDTQMDIDLDIGSRGTISFWYRSNTAWSDSQARQLFDASNTTPSVAKYFFLSLASGTLQFGLEDTDDYDAVLRAVNLNYAADEWVHIAAVWDVLADTMQLFVNGVQVASSTSMGLNGYLADLSTLYIGDNRSNYFVNGSTPNSANGEFDDVRIYRGKQSASAIQADMADVSPCVLVDHYRIEHDGQGLTCDAESMLVKACVDSNCSQLYDQSSSITLSPGTWEGGNTITFTGSITANLSITTAGNHALTKTSSSENVPLRCFNGTTESCDITFVDAGFEFIGATVNDKLLPDQIAESDFSQVQLRAVENNNGVCKAALSGNKTVSFSYNCVSPDRCLTPLGGIAVNNAEGENTGDITLNFNADGIASLSKLNYADAGRLSLSAQATVNSAQILNGSALIDVYPAGLYISVVPSSLANTSTSDTGVYKAGEAFSVQIVAYSLRNNLIPNYQPENMQLSVTRLYPTAADTIDGYFKYGDAGLQRSSLISEFVDSVPLTFNGGKYLYPSAYYAEVGKIRIDVKDADYLGNVIVTPSALTLDPFIPAYYSVEAELPLPSIQNVQSNFTYIGQTNEFANDPTFKISARNALDEITVNNDSADWLLRPLDTSNITYLDQSGYGGTATVAKGSAPVIVGDNNYDGTVYISILDATITYNKVDSNRVMYGPVAPFSALFDITFSAGFFTDSRGICFKDNASDTSCNSFTFAGVGGADMRFGRFAFSNTYGPETEPLAPRFFAEYYDGSRWQINTDDNATAINFSESANHLLLSKKGGSNSNDITNLIDPIVSAGVLVNGVSDGTNDFYLNAPNLMGEVYLRLNPATTPTDWPSYLNYDWNGDGVICNLSPACPDGPDSNLIDDAIDYPIGTISFGLFRGNDKVIQWREVFN